MRSLIRGSLLDGGVAIGGSSCWTWSLLGVRTTMAGVEEADARQAATAWPRGNDDLVHLDR
jgi:hypothetical protein